MHPSIAVAQARLRRRLEARRIAAEDPSLARELRIGRPDQPRAYDDGGLIDVNHVSLDVLCAVEGIGPELASEIVETRDSFDDSTAVKILRSLSDSIPTRSIAPQTC